MTHEEALRFWLRRVNYEQRSAQPGDLKLDRMRALLALLGDPHERLRIVHVAGSKGKGSTSAMLASILQAAGYRVGLFTSPHLVDVKERFQVDGQSITGAELISLLTEIRDVVTQPGTRDLGEQLTFFEIATAVGFLHFIRRRVDLAVLEVGLGGRFDSTNVCRSLLSIITSISFDHTQQLGNTLDRIAFEKAGIIKPGQRVISGVHAEPARTVIARICQERHGELLELDVDFRYRHEPACIDPHGERASQVEVVTPLRRWPKMRVGLVGDHQAANAALAICAIEELQRLGFHVPDDAVARGLAQVRWPARLEILGRAPLLVLDCAHNVASAHALVEALLTSFPMARNGRRLLVFAGNRDKDLQGMLEILAPHFDRLFLTQFDNVRCVPAEQLRDMVAADKKSACELYASPLEAIDRARSEATANDLICVTGSVFLAGEVRPFLAGETLDVSLCKTTT